MHVKVTLNYTLVCVCVCALQTLYWCRPSNQNKRNRSAYITSEINKTVQLWIFLDEAAVHNRLSRCVNGRLERGRINL